jgi:hypothetical protein
MIKINEIFRTQTWNLKTVDLFFENCGFHFRMLYVRRLSLLSFKKAELVPVMMSIELIRCDEKRDFNKKVEIFETMKLVGVHKETQRQFSNLLYLEFCLHFLFAGSMLHAPFLRPSPQTNKQVRDPIQESKYEFMNMMNINMLSIQLKLALL